MPSSLDSIFAGVEPRKQQVPQPLRRVNASTLMQVCASIVPLVKNNGVRVILPIGMGEWGRDDLKDLLQKALKSIGRNLVVVSADDFMTKDGVYTFDAAHLTRAHQSCQGKCIQHLMHKNSVVFVANVNEQLKWIQVYDTTMKYSNIVVKLVPSAKHVAVALGEGNKKNIPEHVYSTMWDRVHSFVVPDNSLKRCRAVITKVDDLQDDDSLVTALKVTSLSEEVGID